MICCRVCSTEYDGDTLVDECPYCDWIESFTEDDNEYDEVNHMTLAEAKANFAKGLNMWGKPLPKVRPKSK